MHHRSETENGKTHFAPKRLERVLLTGTRFSGRHYGQRPLWGHQQAAHMAAPTEGQNIKKALAKGAVHTWRKADVGCLDNNSGQPRVIPGACTPRSAAPTTDASPDVAPVHTDATPVLLLDEAARNEWMMAPWELARQLQKPPSTGALRVVAAGLKEDP